MKVELNLMRGLEKSKNSISVVLITMTSYAKTLKIWTLKQLWGFNFKKTKSSFELFDVLLIEDVCTATYTQLFLDKQLFSLLKCVHDKISGKFRKDSVKTESMTSDDFPVSPVELFAFSHLHSFKVSQKFLEQPRKTCEWIQMSNKSGLLD